MAVLEYAADNRNLDKRVHGHVRIPGFPDQHVWGMANHLFENRMLVATTPAADGALRVSEILEPGVQRLEELKTLEESEAKQKVAEADAATAAAREKKPWWRKLRS